MDKVLSDKLISEVEAYAKNLNKTRREAVSLNSDFMTAGIRATTRFKAIQAVCYITDMNIATAANIVDAVQSGKRVF